MHFVLKVDEAGTPEVTASSEDFNRDDIFSDRCALEDRR